MSAVLRSLGLATDVNALECGLYQIQDQDIDISRFRSGVVRTGTGTCPELLRGARPGRSHIMRFIAHSNPGMLSHAHKRVKVSQIIRSRLLLQGHMLRVRLTDPGLGGCQTRRFVRVYKDTHGHIAAVLCVSLPASCMV